MVNAGLRYDQMHQYTDAGQLSPRASLTYKPLPSTTFHAGYANYFTPPVQVVSLAGELSCGQLVDRFHLAQPTVSHHMKILTEADVLSVRRDRKGSDVRGQHYATDHTRPETVAEAGRRPMVVHTAGGGASLSKRDAGDGAAAIAPAWRKPVRLLLAA